jgi:hypothetical protein
MDADLFESGDSTNDVKADILRVLFLLQNNRPSRDLPK